MGKPSAEIQAKILDRMHEVGYAPFNLPLSARWILHPTDLDALGVSRRATNDDGIPLMIFGCFIEVDESVPPGEFRLHTRHREENGRQ